MLHCLSVAEQPHNTIAYVWLYALTVDTCLAPEPVVLI